LTGERTTVQPCPEQSFGYRDQKAKGCARSSRAAWASGAAQVVDCRAFRTLDKRTRPIGMKLQQATGLRSQNHKLPMKTWLECAKNMLVFWGTTSSSHFVGFLVKISLWQRKMWVISNMWENQIVRPLPQRCISRWSISFLRILNVYTYKLYSLIRFKWLRWHSSPRHDYRAEPGLDSCSFCSRTIVFVLFDDCRFRFVPGLYFGWESTQGTEFSPLSTLSVKCQTRPRGRLERASPSAEVRRMRNTFHLSEEEPMSE
jgi:hypothetical protein